MEAKLRQLMKHEGINSTRLADILGIQASGISHIMSGRNKPSFDFLLKLLQRFPQINPDWLLLDKGPMYRDEVKGKSAQSARAIVAPTLIAEGGANLGFSTGGDGSRVLRGTGGEGAGISRGAGGVGALGGGLQGGAGGVDTPAGGLIREETGVGALDSSFLQRGDETLGRIGNHGDTFGPKAMDGVGNRGVGVPTGRVQGLFGPDNDDIIPSEDTYGDPITGAGNVGRGGYAGHADYIGQAGKAAHAGLAGKPGAFGHSVGKDGGGVMPAATTFGQDERSDRGDRGGRAVIGGHTQAGNPVPHGANRDVSSDAQRFVNQPGMFVPSTDIERIVVFYCDKTFSEYRPE